MATPKSKTKVELEYLASEAVSESHRDCLKDLIVGYPKLAKEMEKYPPTAMFRRNPGCQSSPVSPECDFDSQEKTGAVRDEGQSRRCRKEDEIMYMKKPDPYDIEYMQHFVHSDAIGSCALIGDDSMIWGSYVYKNSITDDLIDLKPR
ncbi:hypothetical protein BCR34DRAFT_591710 [Clohesyomyces aquaticus]|uniref:Uncharacterized protein n=1 Tax=Clohesyomyces aquaticus TaxID=1231657 RepID=A0A1Y1YZR2_9PLEO|nr:hypothetical protein BCR34DRAFT_591710 [Clohesyomyces aquaticus]